MICVIWDFGSKVILWIDKHDLIDFKGYVLYWFNLFEFSNIRENAYWNPLIMFANQMVNEIWVFDVDVKSLMNPLID